MMLRPQLTHRGTDGGRSGTRACSRTGRMYPSRNQLSTAPRRLLEADHNRLRCFESTDRGQPFSGAEPSNPLTTSQRELVVALASIAALLLEQQYIELSESSPPTATPSTPTVAATKAIKPDAQRPVAPAQLSDQQPGATSSAGSGSRAGIVIAATSCRKQFVKVWDEEKEVLTGPGGGQYYINISGRKSYVQKYQTVYTKEVPIYSRSAVAAAAAEAVNRATATLATHSANLSAADSCSGRSLPVVAAASATPTVAAAAVGPIVAFLTNSGDETTWQYVWVSGEKRTVYTGPHGGQYYFTDGGNKAYIGSTGKQIHAQQIASLPREQAAVLFNQVTMRAAVAMTAAAAVTEKGAEYVLVDGQKRAVYSGPRGGLYYYNSYGNKAYVGSRQVYRD